MKILQYITNTCKGTVLFYHEVDDNDRTKLIGYVVAISDRVNDSYGEYEFGLQEHFIAKKKFDDLVNIIQPK